MSTKARIHTVLITSLSAAALLASGSAWSTENGKAYSVNALKQTSLNRQNGSSFADERLLASRLSPYRLAPNAVLAHSQPDNRLPWLAAKADPHPPVPGGALPEPALTAQNAPASAKPDVTASRKPWPVPGDVEMRASNRQAFMRNLFSQHAAVAKKAFFPSRDDLQVARAQAVPGGPIPVASLEVMQAQRKSGTQVEGDFASLSHAAATAAHTSIEAMTKAGSQNFNLAQTQIASASRISTVSMQSPAAIIIREPVHFMAANEAISAEALRLNALSPAAGPAPIPAVTSAPLPPLAQAVPGGLPATPMVTPAFAPPAPAPLPSLPNATDIPFAMSPEQTAEQGGLSPQSRAIVNNLPAQKSKRYRKSVKLEHTQKNPLDTGNVRQHKGMGITISVRTPKANVNHMLEEAYDALIAGNQEEAVMLYNQALAEEPNNKLALFGLATTYHRAGQLQLARPLYGRLLAIDPNNREGLNNFLVLLADESPSEALQEMKRLQLSHPDFSPLPAQIAVLYEKLGDYDSAIRSMKHAIDLSPENIKYRWDMAAMLDKSGDWDNAAYFYQQLLQAGERGEKLPGKAQEIQERLTFIRSNKPTHF